MAKGLNNKRIVIAGSRKVEEMSTLIEKQGGHPVSRPLQGTIFLAEEDVLPDLKQLIKRQTDWFIFTTGVGTDALVDMADKLNIRNEFLTVIQKANIASRGYKTVASLKKLGVQPIVTDDDGTTNGLIRSLQGHDFKNKRVTIQLHGETAPVLTEFLESNGAEVLLLLPYQHIPADDHIAETLYKELIDSKVDAVCFTTAVQVRSLFEFARKRGVKQEIIRLFNEHVEACAVGKVTAEALKNEGVKRVLTPEKERMGALIIELSRYYESKKEHGD
ncbi:uroporphyrinogen-III synthase [Bacillus ectoiniformans]|uniref:uroporphyrinogen-III synthase n=1 Tax=Bacillus ectoiniformans TaxID=1494429 RepID=UPI00195940D0|nr:uroporphyrinogen-III synthase [Bacillus ectoiniformans]MBM7647375.1 uroporphyrinogen-III synthase [Bacillus ectoiniformans]